MKIPWSPADCVTLTLLYRNHTAAFCARFMGRTLFSLRQQVRKLKLHKDPAVAGKLRQVRRTAQPSGYFKMLEPDKPTQRPEQAMRGVVYGVATRPPGQPVNGNALRRAVEWRA